jgi:hypothetical protein
MRPIVGERPDELQLPAEALDELFLGLVVTALRYEGELVALG